MLSWPRSTNKPFSSTSTQPKSPTPSSTTASRFITSWNSSNKKKTLETVRRAFNLPCILYKATVAASRTIRAMTMGWRIFASRFPTWPWSSLASTLSLNPTPTLNSPTRSSVSHTTVEMTVMMQTATISMTAMMKKTTTATASVMGA